MHAESQCNDRHYDQRQRALGDFMRVQELATVEDHNQQADQIEQVAAGQQDGLAADFPGQFAKGN